MKRILLYGFKPYADYTVNVTEKIINEFPEQKGIIKTIFDVKFDKQMFNNTLRASNPEIIIGMGQHPRARKLRLERRARNVKRDTGGEEALISKNGSAVRYVNMNLPVNEKTTITYDAGDYVCNYSMYLMSEYCVTRKSKFAFIHVPVNYSIKFVIDYLQQSFENIVNI
jgi:pyrrolidone-carboxylate peptidase